MIRMREGMVLRISEIVTLEKAVITVTDNPITMAGSNCEVTAKDEQMPNTCATTGLSKLRGALRTS